MNLNQLIYASEINRLGSFSRAAQTLFISQSALSKSIHSLEVELEEELFIRTTEGAVPTEFGRAFLAEAEQTLQHVSRMKEMASAKKGGVKTPLRFSVSCGQMLFASEVFARLLARHLDEDADFQFYQKTYSEVFADVKDDRCDLGVLMTLNTYTDEACALFGENEIEYHALGRLNVGIAVSRNNPLNEMEISRVRKGMLEKQRLLMTKETIYPFTREEIELRNALGNPRVVYVTDNDTAVSLCGQIPAYFCVAQSGRIYNRLNIPLSMVIYPCQNIRLKYEFGWIKKETTTLSEVEKQFIRELTILFGS